VAATAKTIGRAGIALVFGGDNNRQGVLSTVTVRAQSARRGHSLVFKGPVKFAESTVSHITEVILPIVDRILHGLAVTPKAFEISVANLGAAACHDLGIEVSGLSGDLPIVLAMLSAALEMPLRDDFVATGHIASAQGDIVAVRGIPAKLEAAIADRAVRRFLHGDLDKDRSLEVLSPRERDTAVTAIMKACNAIDAKAVHGVDELIAEAFTEEAMVAASLEKGFFHEPGKTDRAGDPVTRAVALLTEGNDQRFWQLLQGSFSIGDGERGTRWLQTYAASFLRRRQYPSGFGARLLHLVCTLPPAIRRSKLEYPLLDLGRCIELVRLAGPGDFADVPVLFDAVRGKVPGDDRWLSEEKISASATGTDAELFDAITAEIREPALVRQFDLPIDSARASYVLASSAVASYDEFLTIVESFFVHLQSHLNPEAITASNLQQAANGGLDLLEQAFWKYGGSAAAFARACHGTDGGLRSVLDTMTERYKAEKRAGHIRTFLQRALKGIDPTDQVRFARGAMERLGPMLPAELRRESPERFAKQIDQIARAYAKSVGSIERLLQAM